MKPDLRIDELQALAVFAVVVREGSLSAAARHLGGTPSAISQRLRRLEAVLGIRLLHRSTRRLALTEAGQRLLGPAERLLADAQAAREALALARDALDGELRISAPVGFARHLGPALAPLLAANPLLRLTLLVDDAMIDLVDHRIDLALRAGQLADSAWVARPLGRFEWLIVAAPAYLARAGVPATPDDLAGHTWLSVQGGPASMRLQGPAGASWQLQTQARLVSNNQLSLLQMAEAGLGLSLQLRPDVDDDLRSGRLVPVLSGWGLPPLPLWAVTPDRGAAQPAKVRHALAALRDTLHALPGVLPQEP